MNIMHRALTVLELLHAILVHLNNVDLLKVSLTCSSWSSLALDLLWEEVRDLNNLIGILATPTQVLNDDLVCAESPSRPRIANIHCARFSDNLYG
jgi:hypothetical protein